MHSVKARVRQYLRDHPDRNPAAIFEPGLARLVSSPLRVLPDFIIIGAQKCGSTSLYKNLCRHPDIAKPLKKEPMYFDTMYSLGALWYRSFFTTRRAQRGRLTFDGSVNALHHPRAPERVLKLVPDARFLLILRNPVDRAYSHYQMSVRNGWETLSFEDAIEREESRLRADRAKIAQNPRYFGFSFMHHSYLARGAYAQQLENWLQFFPRSRFMVIRTEDLQRRRMDTMNSVFDFLGLRRISDLKSRTKNRAQYEPMRPETRRYLVDHFRPENERLSELMEMDLDWDR